MAMYRIDINCDIGEGFGIYRLGQDEDIIELITSANIACGFHAGDPDIMCKTVEKCLARGVAIGAHPGYPDIAGFGRRYMALSYKEIKNMILYQVGALTAIAKTMGGTVEHVKPHGALYNAAVNSMEIAAAIVDAVSGLQGPALMAQAGSKVVQLAREKELKVIEEGFADRRYKADGSLVDRKSEWAVIEEPAAAAQQVLTMIKDKRVVCHGGGELKISVDTVCIHGDNVKAVDILQAIRAALSSNGIKIIKPLCEC